MTAHGAMPRDGAIIFSDLIGKLDMLRVGVTSAGEMVAMAFLGSSINGAAMPSSSIGCGPRLSLS